MNSIIRNIVDRCHVSESNRHVARVVANKIKGWKALDIGTRLYVVSYAIVTHKENVATFKHWRF